MNKMSDPIYREGYLAGYLDGLQVGNVVEQRNDDCLYQPIVATNLSMRAKNCLIRSGCITIADVIALSPCNIETMRNLGSKTAAEIARWLDACGIQHSPWSRYWQE